MRNIVDIIEDDKNGKKLSQTERQIAVAYIQGKYDAVMELKNSNNSNDMEVLDEIRAEIEDTLYVDSLIFGELIDFKNGKISADDVIEEFNRVTRLEVLKIFDKYKAEIKPQESEDKDA